MKYKIELICEDEWERDRFIEWYPRGFKRSDIRVPKVSSITMIPEIVKPEKRGKWKRHKEPRIIPEFKTAMERNIWIRSNFPIE